MGTKKEAVYVKANGLRNELKEIRKSIDILTHALHILIETQTHKRNEKRNIDYSSADGAVLDELYDRD